MEAPPHLPARSQLSGHCQRLSRRKLESGPTCSARAAAQRGLPLPRRPGCDGRDGASRAVPDMARTLARPTNSATLGRRGRSRTSQLAKSRGRRRAPPLAGLQPERCCCRRDTVCDDVRTVDRGEQNREPHHDDRQRRPHLRDAQHGNQGWPPLNTLQGLMRDGRHSATPLTPERLSRVSDPHRETRIARARFYRAGRSRHA